MEIKLGSHTIGPGHPTYFIADIAANHDGELERAIMLIRLAKQAGADAAKFQNFRAPHIVSDYGFTHMEGQVSHQAAWKKSVFQVYTEASIPFEWTPVLKQACDEVGIAFFQPPMISKPSICSIHTWRCIKPARVRSIGSKPSNAWLPRVSLSSLPPVHPISAKSSAVHTILKINPRIVLMQCNTNYTASSDNYDHLHINVLKTYATMFPGVILGLSDHTHALAPVLGAVTLGAGVIERHFTDSNDRQGPDHKFAMDPQKWAYMVEETRLLERCLGSSDKFVAGNEVETAIIQRRCLRAAREVKAGEVFTREMIDVLRPATPGAIKPDEIDSVVGKRALINMPLGKDLRWTELGE